MSHFYTEDFSHTVNIMIKWKQFSPQSWSPLWMCPFSSFLLAHLTPATVASLLFLKNGRHIPTPRPLLQLFPLPGSLSPHLSARLPLFSFKSLLKCDLLITLCDIYLPPPPALVASFTLFQVFSFLDNNYPFLVYSPIYLVITLTAFCPFTCIFWYRKLCYLAHWWILNAWPMVNKS